MKDSAVVVITGASSGIGLACAREFYKNGCRIVIASRNREALIALRDELNPDQKRVLVVRTDVSKEADCKALIEATIQHFGKLDILINNAGITMRALFKDVSIQVLKQLMDVNFWGMIYCTKFAIPHLLKSKGSVVGMSSVAGYKGLPTRTGYSASKFALEGFLETLRIENLTTGLHVLIARPGFTATNIRNTMLDAEGQQQGESHMDEERSMTPEEVARNIYKAVRKRQNYMLLSSTAKLSFWINKFFPLFVDRMVFKHVAGEKGTPLK